VWYDKIRPTLKTLGLSFVNYQVLRRSAATLLNEIGTDGQIVAQQLGHGLDVSQNVYNKVGIQRQRDAVNKLEAALQQNAKKNGAKA
jgi:integrase